MGKYCSLAWQTGSSKAIARHQWVPYAHTCLTWASSRLIRASTGVSVAHTSVPHGQMQGKYGPHRRLQAVLVATTSHSSSINSNSSGFYWRVRASQGKYGRISCSHAWAILASQANTRLTSEFHRPIQPTSKANTGLHGIHHARQAFCSADLFSEGKF